MKITVSGLPNTDLQGDISGLSLSGAELNINIRLTAPLGWHASAALSHKDIVALLKQMLCKPSGLSFVLLGFLRRDKRIRSVGDGAEDSAGRSGYSSRMGP